MVNPQRLLDEALVLYEHAGNRNVAVPQDVTDAIEAAKPQTVTTSLGLRTERLPIKEELALRGAIAKLKRLIAPDRLKDLERLRRRSFVRRGLARLRFPSASTWLSIFTFVLILVVIKFTTDFSKISIVVADIREATQTDYFGQIGVARHVIEVTNVGKKDFLLDESGRAGLRAIRDIDGRLVTSIAVMNEFCAPSYENRYFWGMFGSSIQATCFLGAVSAADQSKRIAEAAASAGAHTAELAAAAAAAAEPQVENAVEGPILVPVPQIDVIGTSEAVELVAQAPNTQFMIEAETVFARALGLTFHSAGGFSSLYRMMRGAESIKLILGGSLLPLLYGVLGSAVFILRQLYTEPDYFGRQFAPVSGTFLRLGLGGVSGLAIGWFWTPSVAEGIGEVANLSTAPFAIAFLAGYSIDLLFSILDRIINAVNPKADDDNGGKNPPGGGQANANDPRPANPQGGAAGNPAGSTAGHLPVATAG